MKQKKSKTNVASSIAPNKAPGEDSNHKRIHNVRFYNISPRSINAMAYNKDNKLAISRADGSIEIWDVQDAAYLEKVIPKSPGNSVDSLAWSGQRLFSAGITGELVEWNLQTLRPQHKQLATGNSIWCLDINPEGTELAVGTEEGYINLFDITETGHIQYKKLLDKHDGRILCCRYDPSGEYLVGGCMATIRIWNARTGHFMNKITMPKAEKNADVIVWSVQILPNLGIIAGDSRGCLTVWDGCMAGGALLESHQALKADVLAVALNEEGNLLICAGIEPIIKIFSKAQIKREDAVLERWVRYLQRSIHDHAVKALLINGEAIYSGGMDGYLGVSSLLRRNSETIKYGPFLKNPCAAVATEAKLLLLQHPNFFEIWRLGTAAAGDENTEALRKTNSKEMPRRVLDLEYEPKKLLQFKRKDEAPIVCTSIAPNGKLLCYSTLNQMRVFNLKEVTDDEGAAKAQIVPVEDVKIAFSGASHLKFSADSKRLYSVSRELRKIFVFGVHNRNATTKLEVLDTISLGKHIKDDIVHFTVSCCGSYIVAAGADRSIAVWHSQDSKGFSHYLNLPKYSAATTALALHSHLPRLVVAFSDGKIFEYDLDEMCFSCTAHKSFVPSMAAHPIWNILLDANDPSVFVLQNDTHLIVLEKQQPSSAEYSVQAKKEKLAESENQVAGLQLRSHKLYEHLVYAGWLQESKDLIAISVNPLSLLEQLPPAFKQKKFGLA